MWNFRQETTHGYVKYTPLETAWWTRGRSFVPAGSASQARDTVKQADGAFLGFVQFLGNALLRQSSPRIRFFSIPNDERALSHQARG